MNGNRVAANALEQRQILGGILSGVIDGAGTLVSQVGDGVTSVVGGVTSAVGGVLTPIIPPPSSTTSSSSTITTTTPTTTSATSTTPTVLTTPSTSATSSTSGRISSSSSSLRPSSSSSSTTPTSTSESVFETTTNGQRHTVTSFVTGSASEPTSTPPPPPKSFLQNKPLSGFVFALCGIVGLVLIILIATFALRRARKRKLEREAVSYDPGRGSYNDDMETRLVDEKGGGDLLAPLARNGSQHSARTYGGSYATGHNPQHGYYDQRIPAYGQYPNYAPRSPNPFEHQQQHQMYPNYAATANYPGAPFPPRSPNPAYDPSAGRLSPTELYRSNTRSSNNSDSGVHPPSTPLPPLPTSLLNGAGMKSPPPAAPSRVPEAPQLPATFGGNGSIDERQGIPPADLRVANQ